MKILFATSISSLMSSKLFILAALMLSLRICHSGVSNFVYHSHVRHHIPNDSTSKYSKNATHISQTRDNISNYTDITEQNGSPLNDLDECDDPHLGCINLEGPNHHVPLKRRKRDTKGVSYRLARVGPWGRANRTGRYFLGTPEAQKQAKPFEGVVFASNYHKGFLIRSNGHPAATLGVGADFQFQMRQFTKPTTAPPEGRPRITPDTIYSGETTTAPLQGTPFETPDKSFSVPEDNILTTPQVYLPDDITHNPYPQVLTPDSGRGVEVFPPQPTLSLYYTTSVPQGVNISQTESTPPRGDGIGHVRTGDDSAASFHIWKPETVSSTPAQDTPIPTDFSNFSRTTHSLSTDTQSFETPFGAQDGAVHEGPGYGGVDRVWIDQGIVTSTLPRISFLNIINNTIPRIKSSTESLLSATTIFEGHQSTPKTSPVVPDFLFESTPRHTTRQTSTLNPLTENITPDTHDYPDTINGDINTALQKISINYSQPTTAPNESSSEAFTEGSRLNTSTPRDGKSYALIDEVGQDRGISILRGKQPFTDSSVTSPYPNGPYVNETDAVDANSSFITTPISDVGTNSTHLFVSTSRDSKTPGKIDDNGIGRVIPESGGSIGIGPPLNIFKSTATPVFSGENGDVSKGSIPPLTTKPGRREPLIDIDTTPIVPFNPSKGGIVRVDFDQGFENVPLEPGLVRPGQESSFSVTSIIPDNEDAMFSPHFLNKFTPGVVIPPGGLPRSDDRVNTPFKLINRATTFRPFSPQFGRVSQPTARPRNLPPPSFSNGRDKVPPSVYGMDMDAWQCEFDTMALNNKREVDFVCPDDQSDSLYPIADKQCLWYVMCSNQHPWYMCCPAGTLFDSVNRKCEHVDRVDCIRNVGYPKE